MPNELSLWKLKACRVRGTCPNKTYFTLGLVTTQGFTMWYSHYLNVVSISDLLHVVF